MTPERWARVQEVFGAALALGAEARVSYMEQACAGDSELLQEVGSLLASHEAATSQFLESPGLQASRLAGHALEPGTRLGHYEILAPIGSGGMGEVYRARDPALDRDVAIKVLPENLMANPAALSRFKREARAVAALSHPNILAIHEFGTQGGVTYAVTELLLGQTLREKLESGPIGRSEAIDLALQLAKGLAAAHEGGVVHRDLKPENIFVSKDGHLKILDFGLAKRGDAAGSEPATAAPTLTDHTQPGAVMGTLGYMSPEQVNGQEVDQRSDIFSFGAILYEMLSGRRAFRKETPADTMAAILLMQPPAAVESRGRSSAALNQIVSRCLEKEREQRYGSAPEIARALSGISGLDRGRRATRSTLFAAGLVAVAIAAGILLTRRSPRMENAVAKRIAVLPFENLGTAEDDYFADGMADEIRSKLTSLPGIEVIARGSSMPYKRTSKKPPEIAQELGVGYLLTATVRWEKRPDGGRVHVVPELVEVDKSGATAAKWQEPFDEPLTDVFRLQSSVAARVSRSLGLVLGARDEERLSRPPTENMAAYDDFLHGESLSLGDRRSVAYYQTAVDRDPRFGLAWAKLARSEAILYSMIPSEDLARRTLEAAERAKSLLPEDPQTFLALGYAEEAVHHDVQLALELVVRGQLLFPNDPALMADRSLSETELGRWREAEEDARAAERLDPRSGDTKEALGIVFLMQRRYREAREVMKEALALKPLNLAYLEDLVMAFLGEGDLVGARSAIKEYGHATAPESLIAYFALHWNLAWVLEPDQADLLLRLSPAAFGDSRRYWAICLAQAYSRRSSDRMVRQLAEIARRGFEASVRANPDDGNSHVMLGLSLAYLGNKDEAIRRGRHGLQFVKLPLALSYFQYELIRIYLSTGEQEAALSQLEDLLKKPGWVSAAWIRIDPSFEPLRNNPRFQKLVAEKGA